MGITIEFKNRDDRYYVMTETYHVNCQKGKSCYE